MNPNGSINSRMKRKMSRGSAKGCVRNIDKESSKNQLRDRLRKTLEGKKESKKESKKDAKICLAMIVKNESKNMVRLFESLIKIIDFICITDTGSTDNTKEIITQWGETHFIPTKVLCKPFKNFSYNRTHSVRMAQKKFPEADYILLSDADFVWEVESFDRTGLINENYLVEQYNSTQSYWNCRLLNARVKWECIGVTHEYWRSCPIQPSYKGSIVAGKLKGIKICDVGDGGCKDDKFVRDERLLREGLADPHTPEDLKTRYYFYLAQTLRDVNRCEESIPLYEERIKRGGWPEEVYYSKYQVGVLYERIGNGQRKTSQTMNNEGIGNESMIKRWNPLSLTKDELYNESVKSYDKAIQAYQEAHNYRPNRGEALMAMTSLYRTTKQHKMAYKMAIIGKNLDPSQDVLFVDLQAYKNGYQYDFELSIVCYYLEGKQEEGKAAIERLLNRKDLPMWIRLRVLENAKFYDMTIDH